MTAETPKFEWRISHDTWNSVISCMPDPDTSYAVIWAAKDQRDNPRGFLVHRSHHKGSGLLGEMNFVVGIHDRGGSGEWPACSIFCDIEEAKELAWRDYMDNILGESK